MTKYDQFWPVDKILIAEFSKFTKNLKISKLGILNIDKLLTTAWHKSAKQNSRPRNMACVFLRLWLISYDASKIKIFLKLVFWGSKSKMHMKFFFRADWFCSTSVGPLNEWLIIYDSLGVLEIDQFIIAMHYLNLLSLAYYPQIEKLAQRKKDSVTILTQLTQFVTRGNHLKSII